MVPAHLGRQGVIAIAFLLVLHVGMIDKGERKNERLAQEATLLSPALYPVLVAFHKPGGRNKSVVRSLASLIRLRDQRKERNRAKECGRRSPQRRYLQRTRFCKPPLQDASWQFVVADLKRTRRHGMWPRCIAVVTHGLFRWSEQYARISGAALAWLSDQVPYP